jgi:hypothetical protein
VRRLFRWQDRSIINNCCWASQAQSYDHILLSQIWRLPQPRGTDSRIYFPPGIGSPTIPSGIELNSVQVEVEVILRPTVSRPVYLGVGFPSGACAQIFLFCLTIAGFLMRGTLSDETMGLWFTRTIASGPCQSSHSLDQVPQNSWPYITVSFETPQTWRAISLYLYPPETGGPVTPPDTGFLFHSLLRLTGWYWGMEVF